MCRGTILPLTHHSHVSRKKAGGGVGGGLEGWSRFPGAQGGGKWRWSSWESLLEEGGPLGASAEEWGCAVLSGKRLWKWLECGAKPEVFIFHPQKRNRLGKTLKKDFLVFYHKRR